MSITETIFELAKPHLEGLTVVDGVIGISFVGIKLSNGRTHFTYLMRECLPSGDLIFPYGQAMIGSSAEKIAFGAVCGAEDLERGLGMAVLCAAAPLYNMSPETKLDDFYTQVMEGETVGLIGYMPPAIKQLDGRARIICFDRAIDLQGTVEGAVVYPVERQAELLPTCDRVIISGTTCINHTLDQLLAWCQNAKDILISGFSLPFFPDAFIDTPVGALSSARFPDEASEAFKAISLGAGRSLLRKYTSSQYCRLRPARTKTFNLK